MYKNKTKKYILNCQRVALHGCHLAKGCLPVTSFKITIVTIDIYTFVVEMARFKYVSKVMTCPVSNAP